MFAAKDTLLTRPSGAAYEISRSLRFNSADSAYLNRTPSSSGNQQKFTFSYWFKRGTLSSEQVMFGINSGGNEIFTLAFLSGDTLRVFARNGGTDVLNLTTTQFFRDPSAWYHIVVAIDTTQATSSNRASMYVNGVQVTAFGTATYPAQNTNLAWNSSSYSHQIGREDTGTYLNGYMTEVNFINAQQLTPSSFGATNAQTGVWGPKAYSGSYGTNGFYINFSDNSNTTAATLGKDYSGNGNNFTPNNFSVTAGAGNDSLVDVPTLFGIDTGVGGEVRGNYATLNPLQFAGTLGSNPANGNLDVTGGGNPTKTFSSTIAATSGKFYAEFIISSTLYPMFSVSDVNVWVPAYNGGPVGSGTISWDTISQIYYINSTSSTANGVTCANNDVIQIAFDADTRKIWFGRNNTWNGSGNPSAGTNEVGTVAGTGALVFVVRSEGMTTTCNFGQRAFVYTAPSGFKALCTQNLSTPTIGATTATQAGKFFNTILWSGDGAGTRSLTGVGFQPSWVWAKTRNSGAQYHTLFDAVRGGNKTLFSNATLAENVNSASGYISSFDSDGISVIGGNDTNGSGLTYVGWNWAGGGTGSSNTAGSITSTVSASTTSGFSVVTYTGTGANATVGHGLGVAPSMVIVKRRNGGGTENWMVYHAGITTPNANPGNNRMLLNLTNASNVDSTIWNNTNPTSTVFSIGTSSEVNANTGTYVAYCFAPIAGYSALGSYIGTGSLDSPFVFTGFRPAFVMIKNASVTQSWNIQDDARSTSNVVDNYLRPNTSDAEASGYAKMDFVSNGFKIRDSDAFVNGNGNTMIFMAFADNPFKYSLAR